MSKWLIGLVVALVGCETGARQAMLDSEARQVQARKDHAAWQAEVAASEAKWAPLKADMQRHGLLIPEPMTRSEIYLQDMAYSLEAIKLQERSR